MFNSAQVNQWLQENVKSPIFHHYLLLSTKSDLLAYPRPSDIKQYRNEAALVVKAWQDADCKLMEKHSRNIPSHKTNKIDISEHEMYALTIETAAGNVLVRAIQPSLLLVLVGCKPSNASQAESEKITTEAKGDDRYPVQSDDPPAVIDFSATYNNDEESISPKTPVASTRASSTHRSKTHSLSNSWRDDSLSPQNQGTNGDASDDLLAVYEQQHADILYLQREKLDQMADWLASRLSEKDFRIKEDNS